MGVCFKIQLLFILSKRFNLSRSIMNFCITISSNLFLQLHVLEKSLINFCQDMKIKQLLKRLFSSLYWYLLLCRYAIQEIFFELRQYWSLVFLKQTACEEPKSPKFFSDIPYIQFSLKLLKPVLVKLISLPLFEREISP